MNKRDGILIFVLLVLAGVSYLVFSGNKSEKGNQIIITLNGEVYGSYPLNQEKEIIIETEYGANTVMIENDGVRMKDADCPDRYCVKQGEISHSKETLVCLPHKLVIEIQFVENKEKKEQVDVIAQ